jgi:hypothetical protein
LGSIVWLASYPKSGNTWLRAFLANVIADQDQPVPLAEFGRYTDNEASGHWFIDRLGGEIRREHMAAVAAMRTEVQRDIAGSGQSCCLVKTHSYFGNAFGHPQINADVTAAAVYVVRNPLDVAISFAKHNGTNIDTAIGVMAKPGTSSSMRADRVFEWTSDWSSHVSSWTGNQHEHLCVLRYEDMLDQPLAAFSKVVEFLKIDAGEKRVRRAIEASSFEQLRKMEDEFGFAERPVSAKAFFREGRKDQWQDVLTEEQRRRIIARHRTQMERFGYV